MTNEVQQNRWDQLIRRVSASIGHASHVTETLTELFPVLDVERVPGELLLLGGTRLGQGGTQVTGAAGESGKAQVFNPADSNLLVTVTTLIVSTTANDTIRISTTNTELATGTGLENFRDRRLPITSRPAAQIRSESAVALADAHIRIRVISGESAILHDENGLAVLPPGSGYEAGSTANAIAISASFLWRERPAEQSELSF